jgi:tRNA-dihydrouridine synthase
MDKPNIYLAPLEGVTSFVFRNAHHRYFSGVSKYFTPFVSPASTGAFSKREMRDVLPENNEAPLVPQLLTRSAEAFILGARTLSDMGYAEVNLNLGCPSGTVAAKGKGAGFLAFPEELDAFLERIFAETDVKISIKSRLGMTEPEEFWRILDIYNKYPISELIVHPRVREDYYRRPVREEYYAPILQRSRAPVCLNGGIVNVDGYAKTAADYPAASGIMIGRGLCADPALARKITGGAPASRKALLAFHDEIMEGYTAAFGSAKSALPRMKELWFYLINLFEGGEKQAKHLRKTNDVSDYIALAHEMISSLPMREKVESDLRA